MKKAWSIIKEGHGFSLVEVLLAGSLFSILVVTLTGSYLYGREATVLAGNRDRATLLAEEGLEAVRNIRDESFSLLVDGNHGLTISDNEWNFSGTQDVTDLFNRQITITPVDAGRKQVTSTVSWQQNPQRTGSVSLVTYLTNWIAQGFSNWSPPVQLSSVNLFANQDLLKIAAQGNYVYAGRHGGLPNFAVIDVSNPTAPFLVGQLNLPGFPQNVAVSGDYVYLASSDNTQELQIINVAIPSAPILVGFYNDPSSENATSVAIVGDTAFMTFERGDHVVAVDISNPLLPTKLDSIIVSASPNEISVVGDYGYIASSSDSEELQVIHIANPSSLSQVGSYNLSGGSDRRTVAAFQDRAVLGAADGSIDIMDTTTPSSPVLLGTYTSPDSVNDIAVGLENTYLFVASDDNDGEFKVIDISTPSTPTMVGSLNIPDDLNGVTYDEISDRAYAVGEGDDEEMIIFGPQ